MEQRQRTIKNGGPGYYRHQSQRQETYNFEISVGVLKLSGVDTERPRTCMSFVPTVITAESKRY